MSRYKDWFFAARPWSFTMSAISVSVGAGMAALDGPFSWHWYLLTVLAMVLIHGATNLSNDYFDVKSGVDKLEAATTQYRPHPLVEGRLKINLVLMLFVLLYVLAGTLGILMAVVKGWQLLMIGGIGLLASYTYTAPPLNYKYYALGEVAVFLMWGPLAVEGAYFVQRQVFSLSALLVSIPFGMLVALVLLANNIRDVNSDRLENIKTLPIILGFDRGRMLYIGLIVLAYAAVTLMSVFGPLSHWSLSVLISLPMAVKLLSQVSQRMPSDADARTAKLNTAFGLLLLVSLLMDRVC